MEPGVQLEHIPPAGGTPPTVWYYIENGVRKGPFATDQMIAMQHAGQFAPDTLVWRQGYPDWRAMSSTELAPHFTQPPPVHRSQIPNGLVWWMAFIPIIGSFAEFVVQTVQGEPLGGLTAALLYFLVYTVFVQYDTKQLEKSGYPRASRWWVLLVPVYLFRRAKKLRQFPLYAIIWFVCFIVAGAMTSDDWSTAGGSSEKSLIQAVQNSTLDDAPERTIGTAVAGVLAEPRWEAFTGDDGGQYVNVTGSMIPSGEEVVLQFLVEDDEIFVHSLAVNGWFVKDEDLMAELRSLLRGKARWAA
ncbi:MAG: DUF4339 domain-containing protein [Paenibacillaceae bacterium]|nr:DUF4339 domain-containing protein [Paenibacillaceae bacterium]